MANLPNQVRSRREQQGLPQQDLAAVAGLTRQSLGAIEAGRSVPSVAVALRLARALECRVEELFVMAQPAVEVRAELAPGAPAGGRVALTHLGGRWIAHALSASAPDQAYRAADGLASPGPGAAGRRARVELLRPTEEARDTTVVLGCAPALGVLLDRLNGRRAGRYLWLARSSATALHELSERRAHVAGVHLIDRDTGEANVPDVRRLLRRRAATLHTLARWEVGLVVARGNPLKVRALADVTRPGVRLSVLEPGSGARRQLETQLGKLGLSVATLPTQPLVAHGQLEAAQSVALGAADVGFAMRSAALAFGLGFVPLAEERFDLVVPREHAREPAITRLLDGLVDGAFRREARALGYDVDGSGDQVGEVGSN